MRPALAAAALVVGVISGALAGCLVERDRPDGGGIHPDGYVDIASDAFHGAALSAAGYPLADCRRCHGDDYHGGSSRVSCNDGGCHDQGGPESCSTCHGQPPDSGAHGVHVAGELGCGECHPERRDARSGDHPGGSTELAFGERARAHGHAPSFDPATRTCADVYCHLGKVPAWSEAAPGQCGACHGDPPASHAQFASTGAACASCHPGGASHVDATVQVDALACDRCHGEGPLGAPPPKLAGAVGADAHARHLDPTLPDRIGRTAVCADCHVVPTSVTAAGHLDAAAPADVVLGSAGTYVPAARSCVVGCHGQKSVTWTDTSGAPRACDACHGFPPVTTSTGAVHPPAAAALATCTTCHVFDVSSHVDGVTDFTGAP